MNIFEQWRLRKQAANIAKVTFRHLYPEYQPFDAIKTGASESNMTFAVTYTTGLPSRPAPYKLIKVDLLSLSGQELNLSEHPNLALRGRK